MRHLSFYMTYFALLLSALTPCHSVYANDSDQENNYKHGVSKKIDFTQWNPNATPISDYSGEFSDRTTVSGDWGGARKKMYNGGFTFDMALTQMFSGGSAGGEPTSGDYYGLFEYGVSFDTGKLNWWSDGLLAFNAMTNFGSTEIIDQSGAASTPNILGWFPNPNPSQTFLMEYYLFQGIIEKELTLVAGRINTVNFLGKNWFANNPRSQYLNFALNYNFIFVYMVSFSTYGILLTYTPNENHQLSFAFLDSAAVPGDYGVPGGLFNKFMTGLNYIATWNVHSQFSGKLAVVGAWSNKDPTDLSNSQLPKDLIEFGKDNLPTVKGNWAIAVSYAQYFWKPGKGSKQAAKPVPHSYAYEFNQRGFGMFMRLGFTPDDRNPLNHMYSIGFGGTGAIKNRPYDRMGIGWYMLKKSKALAAQPGNFIGNENGLEAYYTFAFTPSIQLAGDFQYIRPYKNSIDNTYIGTARLLLQI